MTVVLFEKCINEWIKNIQTCDAYLNSVFNPDLFSRDMLMFTRYFLPRFKDPPTVYQSTPDRIFFFHSAAARLRLDLLALMLIIAQSQISWSLVNWLISTI